jgi:hypothetical protein
MKHLLTIAVLFAGSRAGASYATAYAAYAREKMTQYFQGITSSGLRRPHGIQPNMRTARYIK